MTSKPDTFAVRLRAALAASNVSDKPVDLVKLVARYGGDSVSQQAVSNWLTGRNTPKRRNLRALARLAGVDERYLEDGVDGGRRVSDQRGDWNAEGLDDAAIADFRALTDAQRKLVRDLIAELAKAGARPKR